MNIMPACVHRTGPPAIVVNLFPARRWQSSLLCDRKTVEIRTIQDERAFSIPEDTNDPMPAKLLRDFKSNIPEFPCQSRSGFFFFQRNFRMNVKILVQI